MSQGWRSPLFSGILQKSRYMRTNRGAQPVPSQFSIPCSLHTPSLETQRKRGFEPCPCISQRAWRLYRSVLDLPLVDAQVYCAPLLHVCVCDDGKTCAGAGLVARVGLRGMGCDSGRTECPLTLLHYYMH